MERSPELQTLDERIALIDRQLQLAGQRIDQANARQWTGYLTTDPIAILQNLFGGGQVQQQRMAITDLEIRAADLEAAKAELERQRAAKRSQLGEQVLTLVIAYETAGDREQAILAQLSNHDLLTRITEIDYRLGGSSTETYLTRIAQREQLEIQWNRYRLERETAKRQLLSLTGFSHPPYQGGQGGSKLLGKLLGNGLIFSGEKKINKYNLNMRLFGYNSGLVLIKPLPVSSIKRKELEPFISKCTLLLSLGIFNIQ